MEPARLFPIIVLLPLVTVDYGGWALPGFRTGHGALGGSRKRFFAAGHAHAGVSSPWLARPPAPSPARTQHNTSGRRTLPMPTLPWTIPKPPPLHDEPATVMTSRLELRRLRDVPSFLVAALRIRRQMLRSPGALGVSLIARPLHRTFWTLSAWHDQAALSAAVGREPHREIMTRFRPRMAGSGFVTWTASALPIRWDDALRRLDNPGTVHGPGQRGRAGTADGPPTSRKE